MQCEHCGQRPAAIHLTQIVDDSVTTVHLCEICAEEKGVQTNASVAKFPLSDFLAQMGQPALGNLPAGEESRPCPSCQATLQDFREIGRLGCPACYESFKRHLRDLLRRLHGSSQHVGLQYAAHEPPEAAQDDPLARLRVQLHQAVAAEQFELAADLRDRIRSME